LAIPITSTKKTLEELGGITPPFLWDSICQANRIGNRVKRVGGDTKIGRPVETHTRTRSLSNKFHFFYISSKQVVQSNYCKIGLGRSKDLYLLYFPQG